eukprot:scaffold3394_cov385-Prasinococcus_capsulatus_cf.AAC.11
MSRPPQRRWLRRPSPQPCTAPGPRAPQKHRYCPHTAVAGGNQRCLLRRQRCSAPATPGEPRRTPSSATPIVA